MAYLKNNFSGSDPIILDKNFNKIAYPENLFSKWKLDHNSIYDFLFFTSFLPENSPIKDTILLGAGMDVDEKSDYKNIRTDDIKEKKDYFISKIKTFLNSYIIKTKSKRRNGLMLSGGIDSAILLALLPKNTVCVSWGGWGEKSTDVMFAKKTAAKFDVKEHHFVYPEDGDFSLYLDTIKGTGFPMTYAASIAYIKMNMKFRDLGVDNVYMGQNADTLFLDYPAPILTKKIYSIKKFFPNRLLPLHIFPKKYRRFFGKNVTSLSQIMAVFKSSGIYPDYINDEKMDNYWINKDSFLEKNIPETDEMHKKIILLEEVLTEARKSQIYQNTTASNFGIKMNCPYYSRGLIELVFRIPLPLISEKSYSKQLLKSLARNLSVPDSVIDKGKKGLSWGYSDFIKSKKYIKGWDVFENDIFLNRYVKVSKLRVDKQDIFSVFDILRSLWVWKEIFINKKDNSYIIDKLGM